MSSLRLVIAYLMHRPLLTVLNGLLLALGVAALIILLLFARQAEERLQRDSRGIDLVVGAKGSPMQLILSSIYHLDVPTGNIPVADAQAVLSDPMVKRAIPLALGDSMRGFRIVGTTADFVGLHDARTLDGRLWNAPLEAVLGAQVARETGLTVGATFAGSHGLTQGGQAHGEAPYQVVGILAPAGSVIDRLVLTGVESVWKVHEQHAAQPQMADIMAKMLRQMQPATAPPAKPGSAAPTATNAHADHDDHDAKPRQPASDGQDVTAYLVQYATPLAAAALPRMVNNRSVLQAASPAYETARLLSMLGMGFDTLRIFAVVLIAAAGLGIFIALTNALEERRHDLVLLRVLGARPARLMGLVLLEGVTLTMGGVILGLIFGHAGAELLGRWLADSRQLPFTGLVWMMEEGWLIVGGMGVGAAAALVPALRAYRADLATLLAR